MYVNEYILPLMPWNASFSPSIAAQKDMLKQKEAIIRSIEQRDSQRKEISRLETRAIIKIDSQLDMSATR